MKHCDHVFLEPGAVALSGTTAFVEWTMGPKIKRIEFIYPGTTRLRTGGGWLRALAVPAVRALKAAGETDQVIGNTTSSANVSVALHALPFISRAWDACMGSPKVKEPQSCCIPFLCWPPPV
jgi:hypothetical protein